MAPSERYFSKAGALAAISGLVIYGASNPVLHPQTPPHETEAAFADLTRKWSDLDTNVKLSTLWITASLSYLYCDVISLMDPELLRQYLQGTVNGMAFTAGFLLGAAS